MSQVLDVQGFIEAYKDRWVPELRSGSVLEGRRLQIEERLRMVDLIRNSLTGQEDVTRPIDPEEFTAFLKLVVSGDQAVLPYQRGDEAMKDLATDMLQHWQINRPRAGSTP